MSIQFPQPGGYDSAGTSVRSSTTSRFAISSEPARPATVTAAGVIAIIQSVIAMLAFFMLAAVAPAGGVFVVGGLVGGGVGIWLAIKVLQLRNWARIVMTVLGALAILVTFGDAGQVSAWETLLALASNGVVLILLWHPRSSEAFRRL